MRLKILAATAAAALSVLAAGNTASAQAAPCSTRLLEGIWAFTTGKKDQPASGTVICLVRFDAGGRFTGTSCFSGIDTTARNQVGFSGRIGLANNCRGSGLVGNESGPAKKKAKVTLNRKSGALSILVQGEGPALILHKQF